MHPLRHIPARTAAAAAALAAVAALALAAVAGPRRCVDHAQRHRAGRVPGGPQGRRHPGRALRLDGQAERGDPRR